MISFLVKDAIKDAWTNGWRTAVVHLPGCVAEKALANLPVGVRCKERVTVGSEPDLIGLDLALLFGVPDGTVVARLEW